MSLAKRILKVLGIFLLTVVVLLLVFVGPWPVYSDSKYRESKYYAKAMQDIEEQAKSNDLTSAPGQLQVGWASRDITPPIGTPLAGYGARKNGKKSEGIRDNVEVTALALGDGKDTVVLIGSDLLIIPPNIAEGVRAEVAARTPLTADDLFFNASHTHCSVGAFGPGLVPYVTGGKYDPSIPPMLIAQFADAVVEAFQRMEPAAIATKEFDVPQHIKNRARTGPVDPVLNLLAVKQADGDMLYLTRYSAHPTIFGSGMMLVSAEYPGELKKAIETETRQEAHYLGGAVGSMGPSAPEGPDADARVTAMGQALARIVLDGLGDLEYRDRLDVASVGIALGMPPMQIRPAGANWRLSPFLANVVGLPKGGWIHGARVGDIVFMGMPCDFSGEISNDWRKWAQDRKLELWTMSFCATYCGYFSPDKYYNEEPLGYETGAMSWFGPQTEAYFTDLYHKIVETLAAPLTQAAGA